MSARRRAPAVWYVEDRETGRVIAAGLTERQAERMVDGEAGGYYVASDSRHRPGGPGDTGAPRPTAAGLTMTTRKTSTGHTLTIDTTRMLLSIAGPTETMDGIPDAEIHAACAEADVEWRGEVVDETTYRVHPVAKAVRLEVRASEWGGALLPGGWHPAVAGPLNGRNEPDDVASTFVNEAEAALFVATCLPNAVPTGDGEWQVRDDGDRIVVMLRTVEVRS